MKKLTARFALVFSCAALLAGCNVEKSDKYQSLLSSVDSLKGVNRQLNQDYNETLDMLNEIESSFTELQEAESSLIALSIEHGGDTVTRRDVIMNKIDHVKSKIAEQQERIDNLQSQLAKSNAKNKTLNTMVSRLQGELEQKSAVIADLQKTVEDQTRQIGTLKGNISSLEQNVASLQQQSDSQKKTIATQDANINTVNYICGTEAELIEWGLFAKKGIFDAGHLTDLQGTAADFKSFDRRRVSAVPTNGKKIKLLTPHPDSSYSISTEEDGTETINIIDADTFWSISRYLVVRVKR